MNGPVAVTAPLAAAVFASGGGTNFQALLDHQDDSRPWKIVLLVSDRDGAGALERARSAGIDTAVIPARDRPTEDVTRETLATLEEHDIGVVFLAGYLRLLPVEVVARYRRRILNIHPALLPAFGGKGMYGMNVHRAVLESGVPMTGATVHFVDEEYDQGAVVAQWPVPLRVGDTAEDVAARVLEVEHRLYPEAADHVCCALAEGREPAPFRPTDAPDTVVVTETETPIETKTETPIETKEEVR